MTVQQGLGASKSPHISDEQVRDYLEKSFSKALSSKSLLGIEKHIPSFLSEGDSRPFSDLTATEYSLMKDSLLKDLTGDPLEKGRSALRARAIFERLLTPEHLEEGLLEALKGKIPENDLEDLFVLPLPYLVAYLDLALSESLDFEIKALLLMEAYKSFTLEFPDEKLHEGSIGTEVLAQLIARTRLAINETLDGISDFSAFEDSFIELMEDTRAFSIEVYTSILAKLIKGTSTIPTLDLQSFSHLVSTVSKFLASEVDSYSNEHLDTVNSHLFRGELFSAFTDNSDAPYFAEVGDFVPSSHSMPILHLEELLIRLEELYVEGSRGSKLRDKTIARNTVYFRNTLEETESELSRIVESSLSKEDEESFKKALRKTNLPKNVIERYLERFETVAYDEDEWEDQLYPGIIF